MAADAHVFPGYFTLVLSQLSLQSHRLLFSHGSVEVRGENTPERKFASIGDRTHNHMVTSPTRSPLSHPGGASCFDDNDLILLPPCRGSLEMHIRRANYQAHTWLRAEQRYPDIPFRVWHGCKLTENNSIEYEWTSGYIFQQELVDIMCSKHAADTEDDDNADLSTEA